MHRILDDLLADHERIRTILALFERELDHLKQAVPADLDLLEESIDYCRQYLDGVHHRKEDFIAESIESRDGKPLDSLKPMSKQHAELARISLDIETVFGQVRDGVEFLRDDLYNRGQELLEAYKYHLQWEEENFFPFANDSLDEKGWAEILSRIDSEPNPFRQDPPKWRYRMLSKELQIGSLE